MNSFNNASNLRNIEDSGDCHTTEMSDGASTSAAAIQGDCNECSDAEQDNKPDGSDGDAVESMENFVKRKYGLSDTELRRVRRRLSFPSSDADTEQCRRNNDESDEEGSGEVGPVGSYILRVLEEGTTHDPCNIGVSDLLPRRNREFYGRYPPSICEWFDSVYDRLDLAGNTIFQLITNNTSKYRRILHDSINFRKEFDGHFRNVSDKLCRSLGKCGWFVLSFHEDNLKHIDCDPRLGPILTAGQHQFNRCHGTYSIFKKEEDYYQIDEQDLRRQIGIEWTSEVHREEPESGHFHVYHACEWNNRECRHLGGTFDIHPRRGLIEKSSDISLQHVKNTLFYLGTLPRWINVIQMSNERQQQFIYRAECIPPKNVREGSESDQMEEGPDSDEIRYNRDGDASAVSRRYNTISKAKNNRGSGLRGDKTEGIIDWTLKLLPFPLENILRCTAWQEDSAMGTTIASDKQFQRAMILLQTKLSKWTMHDYMQLYMKTNPLFAAADEQEFEEYYYTIAKSIEIIEKLLDFQLDSEEMENLCLADRRKVFLQDLLNVLEKKLPKVNAFMIKSPPSAGKNFMLDAVMAFYLNVGMIQNFNKFNSFPLQEAVNRRVNCWNEPNIEPAAFDTVKMLLAGDPMKAHVKYQAEQPLARTPILIMTNNECFPNNDAFNDRLIRYNWKRATFLRSYTKKIHPLMWGFIYWKYENPTKYAELESIGMLNKHFINK